MKNITLFRCLVIGLMVIVNADCKKVVEPLNAMVTSPPQPLTNITALKANAGRDQFVFLPTDYCTIFGGFSFSGYGSVTVLWNKISGPTSFFIEKPNSFSTKVSKLIKGVYQFEITVLANGLTDKDTCTVTVGTMSPNPNEIIFENRNWGTDGLLWGSSIVITNIHQFVPSGTVFKIYIRRDSTTVWEELVQDDNNSWYVFSMINGSLNLWSTYEETDTPDIKLVY